MIVDGPVVKGRKGFGGELGHVLIPYQSITEIAGLRPDCNCGQDRRSRIAVLADRDPPDAAAVFPLAVSGPRAGGAATGRRGQEGAGMAERGDAMCRDIFQVQARALGLFFDEMINTFDPDALIVGGGAIETGQLFQRWFIDEVRRMPVQREEQADIPIHIMPNGDTAGARGAAIEALVFARKGGLL